MWNYDWKYEKVVENQKILLETGLKFNKLQKIESI